MKEYALVTSPNYSYTLPIESDFVYQEAIAWMGENWTLSLYYIVIYAIFIFGGQYVMLNKPRFELRILLFLWNFAIALFSTMGALRTIPEFLHILTNYGLYHSICVPSFIEQDRVTSFWTFMFVISKLPELGDTVFIVLRKRPLTFLHCYHHASVLLCTWYAYAKKASYARWFIVMNYSGHAVIYSYYALRAVGYSPRRQFPMVITSFQLIQMVLGGLVSVWAQRFINENRKCEVTPLIIKLSIAIYFSYFVLFARYYYKAYLFSEERRKIDRASTSSEYVLSKSKMH